MRNEVALVQECIHRQLGATHCGDMSAADAEMWTGQRMRLRTSRCDLYGRKESSHFSASYDARICDCSPAFMRARAVARMHLVVRAQLGARPVGIEHVDERVGQAAVAGQQRQWILAMRAHGQLAGQ